MTVSSSTSDPGAYATLTFKVPNESDTASTTRLAVDLPTDTPFTSVLAQDVPGWTAELVTSQLGDPIEDGHGDTITSAVTSVVWTAADGGINPGRFDTFTLSVGPLPESGTLYLPTVQQYSDGSEAAWVQQAQGNAEPEHPAPSLTIGESTAGAAHTSGSAGHTSTESDSSAAPTSSDSGTNWGVGLGIAGIVFGLVAGAAAAAALRGVRRLTSAGPAVTRHHDDSSPALSTRR